MFSQFRRLAGIGLAVLLCAAALGCGDGKTFRVSGTVTFNGQPVPAGKVYILPDSNKGNEGPAGFADIRDGRYDTASAGGRGAVAGAVIFAVEGIDPKAPPTKTSPNDPEATVKVLFPRYELTVELPAAASTKDIPVPASAAKGPNIVNKGQPMIIP